MKFPGMNLQQMMKQAQKMHGADGSGDAGTARRCRGRRIIKVVMSGSKGGLDQISRMRPAMWRCSKTSSWLRSTNAAAN
jgi:hypothetical protein